MTKRQGFTQHHFFLHRGLLKSVIRCLWRGGSGAGFTMVELLVYIGISSIALVVFMNFAIGTTTNDARTRQAQELQQSARLIFDRLSQEVRQATNVIITNPTTLTIVGPTTDTFIYDPAAKILSLNSVSLANSNNISVSDFALAASTPGVTVTLGLTTKTGSPAQSLQFTTTLIPHQLLYQ